MAAANSDQENVLLQSDEGSPSAPPPAGRLPFKAALAVGLCVFAAGLAGAVMMGKPAARAPTNIWNYRWSAIGLSEHEYKHLTEECQDLLEALEKEAEEEGRTHQTDPMQGGLDCKEESEQACTVAFSMYGQSMTMGKCFPAVCKEANIFKELEAHMAENAEPDAELSGLEVSCAAPGDEDHDFEAVGMTKECLDLLGALEEEAEEEGRTHQTEGQGLDGDLSTLDCKDSEQTCKFEYDMYGMEITQGKCFPAVCKEENIFKTLEMGMATAPPEAQVSGLEVSCSPPVSPPEEEAAKSRAGQCGPEVGLIGASVLVASIFAQ